MNTASEMHHLVKLSKDVLLESGEFPASFLIDSDQACALVAVPSGLPSSQLLRQHVAWRIGQQAAEDQQLGQLLQVAFICEAWGVQRTRETLDDVLPSESPDRIELLTISIVNAQTGAMRVHDEVMVRNAEGQLVEIVPHSDSADEPKMVIEHSILASFMAGWRGEPFEDRSPELPRKENA